MGLWKFWRKLIVLDWLFGGHRSDTFANQTPHASYNNDFDCDCDHDCINDYDPLHSLDCTRNRWCDNHYYNYSDDYFDSDLDNGFNSSLDNFDCFDDDY